MSVAFCFLLLLGLVVARSSIDDRVSGFYGLLGVGAGISQNAASKP